MFWWDEEGLGGRRRRERAQTTHLALFGPLVSVPVVYAPCIYVPKVGSDRLEPHHDRLWPSRSRPTFRPGRTAHNRLCAVRPGFSYFEKIYEPVAVPVWPKKGKKTGPNRTFKHYHQSYTCNRDGFLFLRYGQMSHSEKDYLLERNYSIFWIWFAGR